ncbi:uncharacterized protein LOC129911066 [Episyrphus balteatus]|uniref:uncharacterized protein LOC129911066 n=1 Tax=Episyrphus balteatus TaxID=286459 RepID=UPI002484ED27|nr:uncharacterized protein LOC129911066 [Episyrphus balteatus]
MKFFIPTTSRGERINSIMFWLLKFNWVWPLAEDSPEYQNIIVNCLVWILLSGFFAVFYAEYLFIKVNQKDISQVAEGLCALIIGTQGIVRVFHLILRRNQMRDVLQKFYKKIYVEKTENEKLHTSCENSLRLVYFMTWSFLLTLFFIYLSAAIKVARDPRSNEKPYLVKMEFFYDAQEPWKYAFTVIYTGYVGFCTACIISAEDFIVGSTLTHCAARYQMLHKDLSELYEKSLKSFKSLNQEKPDEMYNIFRANLKVIIKKQQNLDKFLQEIQSFLSLPIFSLVLFGVFLMCTVAFALQRNGLSLETFRYFFWLVSICLQFLMIGSFGQRCTDAAAQMSESYYMCNWELILFYGNTQANVRLIKDISFAIYRSQKSVHLNGMNFMVLSSKSIGSAMSSSVSYFMFLNEMDKIG